MMLVSPSFDNLFLLLLSFNNSFDIQGLTGNSLFSFFCLIGTFLLRAILFLGRLGFLGRRPKDTLPKNPKIT